MRSRDWCDGSTDAEILDKCTARMDAAEASIETKETPPVTQPNINAVECFECGHIEEDPEYESAHPGDSVSGENNGKASRWGPST